jgi:hypothetical protein
VKRSATRHPFSQPALVKKIEAGLKLELLQAINA